MGHFPLELLEDSAAVPGDPACPEEVIAQRIAEFFTACSIRVAELSVDCGPCVGVFVFQLEAGVRFSLVSAAADDLQRLLGAESVFITRVPGRQAFTVHVSYACRAPVGLRELLRDERELAQVMALPMVLGSAADGGLLTVDLSKMPHLLLGGAPKSGKSVAMRSMLASLVYRLAPVDLRVILVDSAGSGLAGFETLPHLLAPAISDPALGVNALQWAVREMEDRYRRLADAGVRNIEQYNRGQRAAAEPSLLPRVVIAIDELAELMGSAKSLVENAITQLAQMSRAVGIHLLLATSNLSVDVITGLIKANLPARMAFKCRSAVGSRTLLDAGGAERLLGNGDALFLAPMADKAERLHTPFISSEEATAVSSYLCEHAGQLASVSAVTEARAGEPSVNTGDELYDQAARFVVGTGEKSISRLQRHLRIGFSRAARLLDRMSDEGLV